MRGRWCHSLADREAAAVDIRALLRICLRAVKHSRRACVQPAPRPSREKCASQGALTE